MIMLAVTIWACATLSRSLEEAIHMIGFPPPPHPAGDLVHVGISMGIIIIIISVGRE